MQYFTFRFLSFFLAVNFMMLAVPQLGVAQTIRQATTVTDQDNGCVALLVCGSISNGGRAVDASTTTAASISPPLAIGTAALRVGFATPIPAGSQVRMLVSFTSGSALSLGLVNNTTINTYMANGNNAMQTMNMGNVLNLTTLNDNVLTVDFTTSSTFQELELRTGSLLAVNVGYSIQLYHVTATVANPLPVELLSFTGKARANTVELNWETASEHNSAHFMVERATDAQGEYQPIGKLAAAGSSAQRLTYHFADKQPLALGYYRLQQVDQDGKIAYSPIIALTATPGAGLALQAYPNPTDGLLQVAGLAHTRFALVNRLGQIVQQGEILADQPATLNVSNQPDGMYFLRNQDTGTTVKVVKAMGSVAH